MRLRRLSRLALTFYQIINLLIRRIQFDIALSTERKVDDIHSEIKVKIKIFY
jgi:hypothetical protein